MPNVNAILLILAALWGSVSAKASMFAVVNGRRDTILTGTLDKVPLTTEHRRMIFERDWKPIGWGTVIVSWLFALVVIFIPYLLSDLESIDVVTALCFVVAAYNALAGFATVRHLLAEQRYLENFLRLLESKAPAPEELADGTAAANVSVPIKERTRVSE